MPQWELSFQHKTKTLQSPSKAGEREHAGVGGVHGNQLLFSIVSGPLICVFPLLFWQVVILLYLAEVTVRLTWHQALDPDNHCIPYLTGLGDLLGTSLLALCFFLDWLLRGRANLQELVSELVSVPP